MSNSPPSDDVRLVRLPVPARLLREIDDLVLSGRGGYETRGELMLDALQNHVLEVKYGAAEGGQRPLLSESEPKPPAPTRTSTNGSSAKTQSNTAAPVALS